MYSPEKDNNDTRTWPFNEACQMRLQELSDSLTEALAALKNDELLAAMFDDKTSKGFAKQRIREIIEECIDNDRETLIKHLYKQNALLQEDYNRLDEEYLKVFNEQKEMTSEFNNKINEMEREKRLLEDKLNNLKKSMQEKEEHYENQLKEKEEELFMRIEEYENSLKEKENRLINKTEVESREVLSMNSKLKELENKLKESEHKNQDLSHKYQDLSLKHTTLQSELDLQKAQIRDKDVMLQAKTGRYEEVNAAVSQYEASQKELKAEVERLIAENSKLEVSLEVYEEGKRAFEDDFRMRIQEIDKGIHNERATYQEKLNKQHKKYEAKMNQYKAKILEYKNKLTEKQKEFDESLKRTEESMFFQDKSSEMLKLKLEEELEFSNRKFQQLEEENNKKLKETSVMYESQMKRLETHFEELFHQKVSQIQEEVRQLQESLAEKTRLMERDYIRLSDHEEAIREKNSMISRLNQDILDKESQFNHELNYKMRELEKKVAEDYEKRQSMSERNVLELENRLSELRVQKKKTDTALTAVEGERNTLKEETESMVIQKRKLAEKAEEWHSKYQGLNVTYEAEKKRREEAEIKLREFQQKFSEVKRAYEALSGESAEKDIQTSKLADQLANVERRLLEKGSQYDALQGEFENLEKEYMRIREQLEISKRAETQNRVRATEAEEKIKVLNTEIQDSERRSERLKVQVETLDKQVADLSFRLSKTETNFSKTSKEKIELQKDFEKTLLKTKKLKQSNQNIGKTFAVKFAGLKSALREALSYYKVNISRLQKENELKIVELSKVFSTIIEKSKGKHHNEVENIKADLQEEMNYNHECLKDKYVRLQKDQTELFEQKCLDKDRTIKHLQEAQSKLTQKNMDLEVVLDRLEAKYSHLFEEKSHILQEKEELVQRLENQRKKYVEEINNFNMGMKQSSKEFSDQKMIMQEDYQNHIESLTSEVNEVKKRHKEVLIKLANQVEELASKHREENEKIEAKYIEEMQNFEQVLTESRMVEQELATKTLTLTENSNILEKKNKELESEISILREKEDKYLDQYESKMNLLKEMIEKDNVRMNQFRSEKFAEISQQKSTIQMLEKETALKEEKINELIEEKDTLKRQLDDVMSQHDLQESRSSNNAKQNVNQETTKLRYLLSDSLHHTHSTPNLLPTKKFDKENFKSEDNSRYYESVLDKNDPTRFTFNQSYQGRRLESSAEPRASAKQTFKTDGKFHRKGRLSMHDFS